MYSVKSQVFNYLTKAQKSDLCHYIASFVKKHFKKQTNEIVEIFLEDEKHYLLINASRFPWMSEYIEDTIFLKDLELFIKDNQKKYAYKEKQKPLVEKQKKYAKQQRKKAQELKMSKEPPTKAQVSYYKALCKKYGLEHSLDKENNSKLDFKQAIQAILEENKNLEKAEIIDQLNTLKKI